MQTIIQIVVVCFLSITVAAAIACLILLITEFDKVLEFSVTGDSVDKTMSHAETAIIEDGTDFIQFDDYTPVGRVKTKRKKNKSKKTVLKKDVKKKKVSTKKKKK